MWCGIYGAFLTLISTPWEKQTGIWHTQQTDLFFCWQNTLGKNGNKLYPFRNLFTLSHSFSLISLFRGRVSLQQKNPDSIEQTDTHWSLEPRAMTEDQRHCQPRQIYTDGSVLPLANVTRPNKVVRGTPKCWADSATVMWPWFTALIADNRLDSEYFL